MKRSHDLPVGACGTHSDAGRDHGDTSVAGISEGDRPHSRSDPMHSDRLARRQERNKLATKLPPGVDSSRSGSSSCCVLKQRFYGLVSGPIWLRASLTVGFVADYQKIRTTKACSHCSVPMKHRKANCCSTLTISWIAVRRLTARP